MDNAVSRPRSGSEKRQRESVVRMRCTSDELAQLEAAAERAGMPVGAFMRHQCLGTAGPRAMRRPPVEREVLSLLLGQLGKVGSNLNQIARALNSDREVLHDVPETMAQIREAGLAISSTLRGGR